MVLFVKIVITHHIIFPIPDASTVAWGVSGHITEHKTCHPEDGSDENERKKKKGTTTLKGRMASHPRKHLPGPIQDERQRFRGLPTTGGTRTTWGKKKKKKSPSHVMVGWT